MYIQLVTKVGEIVGLVYPITKNKPPHIIYVYIFFKLISSKKSIS